jgi:hypothetical protein
MGMTILRVSVKGRFSVEKFTRILPTKCRGNACFSRCQMSPFAELRGAPAGPQFVQPQAMGGEYILREFI